MTQNAHEKLFTKMLGSKSRDTLPYPVKLRSQKMLYIFNGSLPLPPPEVFLAPPPPLLKEAEPGWGD